jgi:hypothetical protein
MPGQFPEALPKGGYLVDGLPSCEYVHILRVIVEFPQVKRTSAALQSHSFVTEWHAKLIGYLSSVGLADKPFIEADRDDVWQSFC